MDLISCWNCGVVIDINRDFEYADCWNKHEEKMVEVITCPACQSVIEKETGEHI